MPFFESAEAIIVLFSLIFFMHQQKIIKNWHFFLIFVLTKTPKQRIMLPARGAMSAEATKTNNSPPTAQPSIIFFGTRVSESLQFVGEASLTLNYRLIFLALGKIYLWTIQLNFSWNANSTESQSYTRLVNPLMLINDVDLRFSPEKAPVITLYFA